MVELKTTYRVTASREPSWWALVADVGDREVASQSRRLDQAEAMIREAIALVLDVDEHSFEVDIRPTVPETDLIEVADELRRARESLEERVREVTDSTADIVSSLRAETDLTVRDIAGLVGVTPARVSQLVSQRASSHATKTTWSRRKVVSMASESRHDPPKSGGWDVRKPGAKRATETQREAIDRAREIVRNAGAGEIKILGRDGRIRDPDTSTSENEPNPSPDHRQDREPPGHGREVD